MPRHFTYNEPGPLPHAGAIHDSPLQPKENLELHKQALGLRGGTASRAPAELGKTALRR